MQRPHPASPRGEPRQHPPFPALGSTDYPAWRFRRRRAFWPSRERPQGSHSEFAVLKPRFA
jgi:hypothetical protein